jgi:subtilisin family serine protease
MATTIGTRVRLLALAFSLCVTVAACSGSSGDQPSGPTGALVSLAVFPAAVSLPIDRSLQLAAVATLDDGTRFVTTTDTSWTSSLSTTVVSVAAGMLAPSGNTVGTTSTITATYKGKSGTAIVTLAAIPPAIGPGNDTDPLIPQQWHLENTGQTGYAQNGGLFGNDINAALTYLAGITGKGVKVAVVDSGLEIGHEDLAGNVASGSWNFTSGTADPTTTATMGDHGTSVAGLIAAARGNAVGGMGVAPGAKLNGYNLLQDGNQTLANFVASLGGSGGAGAPTSEDAWIFNQSYGSSSTAPMSVNSLVERQYLDGVTTLRGGLGAIYVKSAGNGFEGFEAAPPPSCAVGLSCENASTDPANTLPMNIVVGAVNAAESRSSYSTAGSAIWIAAFGGEDGSTDPAMVTVDQSGCASGYSRTGAGTGAFNDGGAPNLSCNYTSTFNGTSSAAPVTTGVIALILEANPALGWRDVKHVLATTARPIDAAIAPVALALGDGAYTAEPGWTTNAAGYTFHNWYGFGLVDTDAAVSAAYGYLPGQLGTFQNTGWLAGTVPVNAAIADNTAAGVSATAAVARSLTVEAVQIQVSTDHTYLGDLGVELLSPSGTRSVLLNAANGFGSNAGTATFQLASNAFYGEIATGTWTLKVVDALAGDIGNLIAWNIRIYGH